MERFMQIKSDDYVVKVNLEDVLYDDLSIIFETIDMDYHSWEYFNKGDTLKLNRCDKYLKCTEVNHEEKIIIFS